MPENHETNPPMLPPVVKYVFVYPKSVLFVHYIINESKELHAKNYDDMYSFVVGLVSSQASHLRHLLDIRRSFILYVEEKAIEELVFDYSENLEKAKKTLLSFNLAGAEIALQQARNKDKLQIAYDVTNLYRSVIDFYNNKVNSIEQAKQNGRPPTIKDSEVLLGGKTLGLT